MKSVLEVWSEKVKANKNIDSNSKELLRRCKCQEKKKVKGFRNWIKAKLKNHMIDIEYYGYGKKHQICWTIILLNPTKSKYNKFFRIWVRDRPCMNGLYLRYGHLGKHFKKIF